MNINNKVVINLVNLFTSVTPNWFLADPLPFRGVSSLTISTPGCIRNPGTGFICPYDTNTILGDNAPVPPQPSLENSGGGNTDIGKFLVWSSGTNRPYITFAVGREQSVTAINIEFLNYPAQGFSLPDLELYGVATATIVDPNNAQRIEFDLQNNNLLSQDDYQVTSVSLIFPRISQNILIRWNYTGVYNLDFFMVSEVDFCSDNQPTGETQITFQDPQSDNSVIRPTVEELTVTRTITFKLHCLFIRIV